MPSRLGQLRRSLSSAIGQIVGPITDIIGYVPRSFHQAVEFSLTIGRIKERSDHADADSEQDREEVQVEKS